jgi:hypothetical protein
MAPVGSSSFISISHRPAVSRGGSEADLTVFWLAGEHDISTVCPRSAPDRHLRSQRPHRSRPRRCRTPNGNGQRAARLARTARESGQAGMDAMEIEARGAKTKARSILAHTS